MPIYASLACLGGYVWKDYIEKGENENIINKCVYVIGSLFLLVSIGGILTPLYLPAQLSSDIASAKVFCILSAFAVGLASILFAKKRIYLGVFASYVIFMSVFSAFATEKFFEIDYKFGQDDLMEFAQYAKENNVSLTTFNFGHKYSLLYYGGEPVVFGPELEPKDLPRELDKKHNVVIVRNKEMKDIANKNFVILKKGRKYSIIDEVR